MEKRKGIHDQAALLTQALMRHIDHVVCYCLSYPTNIENFQGRQRIKETQDFVRNAERLLSDLDQLCARAQEIHALRYINFEQIEAKIQTVRKSLLPLRAQCVEVN